MNTIFKYKLNITENVQRIAMPTGAEVLTAQRQNDELVIWAQVDSEARYQDRQFIIGLTGRLFIPPGAVRYIATVQFVGAVSTLVCHVFEIL